MMFFHEDTNLKITEINSNISNKVDKSSVSGLSVSHANSARYIDGMKADTSSTWGNQTGSSIVNWATAGGGGVQFRDNNPTTGQVSMIIDGTVYVNEGKNAVISTADIGNQSVKYATTAGLANSVAWGNVTGKPATYAPSAHTHTIDQVTNLQSSLDGKAAKSHTHAISGVSNLQSSLDGKAAKSHTHAIGDITNLQSTINTINSNKADKSSFTNAGYNSWVVIRNDGTVGAHGTYPTSGYTELIVVLRYSDSNQTEFHTIPCVDGSPWFAYSKTNGCYMGKGDVHDATAANFNKYGVYFNTTGQFAAGSSTAVYLYGRKKLW